MKIDINNVYIGSINKCIAKSNFCSKPYIAKLYNGKDIVEHFIEKNLPYKEDAILLKIAEDGYVDLDTLNTILDEIKIKRNLTKDGGFKLDSLILTTEPHKLGSLYVDESTLMQYRPLEDRKKTTVKKLKKAVLKDISYFNEI